MSQHIKPENLEWKQTSVDGFSSKELISQGNGGVKLIRIEPNSIYPLHEHPEKLEYIYILEGTIEVQIGENNFTGTKGEFLSLPHSIKHSISNSNSETSIILIGSIKN